MSHRVVCCGMLVILLSGMATSAFSASNRAGLSSGFGKKRVRAVAVQRHRTRAASSILGTLDLRRLGPLPSPGQVSAASAILVDGTTGEILFERNPDEVRPPASITKILTALVLLEKGRLPDSVLVSEMAAGVGGHRLGLRPGQRISLNDLLAAILIRSANDAAMAAAEHVGRGLPGFVHLMNAKARELGMHHSRFENPHGLDDRGHYTTARDMAVLTRAALEHPVFARLVRAREAHITIWQPGRRGLLPRARVVQSHNRLLGRLDGADGVKTGYTDGAGRCLVASASRDGRKMIAVLLKDPHRWIDAAALLEFGFGVVQGATRPASSPWRAAGIGVGHG